MKKAILRILCLLLGLNVFTACYGPAMPPPPDSGLDQARVQENADEAPEEEALEESQL